MTRGIDEAKDHSRVRISRWLIVMAGAALIPAAAMTGARVQAAADPGAAGAPGDQAVAGTIRTVAGGAGGPGWGTTVAVNNTCGVTSFRSSVYFAGESVARKVDPDGWLTTVAGNGVTGGSGDGGLARQASLYNPCGLVFDHHGNLVIPDVGNYRVWVVAARTGTFYGQAMTARHIYTVAGTSIPGFSGDGGPGTQAMLRGPYQAAVDRAGNLLIADASNNRIRVLAARTGTFYGQAMSAGYIYTIAGGGSSGVGDGGLATRAGLAGPEGVAADAAGNVVIGDTVNDRVRVVAAHSGTFYGQAMRARHIYTVAGTGTQGFSSDGTPATDAKLFYPAGMTVDAAGNLLIAEFGNSLVRMVAESTGAFYGRPVTAGDIYTVAGNGELGYTGDGVPAISSGVYGPQGVAVDRAGNLLIADTYNHRIRVVAASTGTFYRQPMITGDIYTVAGNGALLFSGDGGLATRAEMYSPQGVATDAAGNLLIAATRNNRIRVVAARTGTFYGQPMTARHIYTVAGNGTAGFSGDAGPAASAELNTPARVMADAAGNLLIADNGNSRIRVVAARTGTFYGQPMAAGDIYTVAGNGTAGFSGDAGPAASAELNTPTGIAADAAGNLLIADNGNGRIRVVAARTGTFYGQPMAAGDIYTVAGNGTAGFSGDGGPAASAELNTPARRDGRTPRATCSSPTPPTTGSGWWRPAPARSTGSR